MIGNIKKAYYFAKKNGIKNMCYASAERVLSPYYRDYTYEPVAEHVLQQQRNSSWKEAVKFSIVVPLFRTRESYLRKMIESVLHQTYGNLELILVDAGAPLLVSDVVKQYDDSRIKYVVAESNEGISQNTNKGIQLASGDYIGLLDHDDFLTLDALYEMCKKIQESRKQQGENPLMIYSDEDKCDESGTVFYEPNFKDKLNLDLILSNNYVCHFMVVESEWLKNNLLREKYDGAQDYDLVLRCVMEQQQHNRSIDHVGKVLYHWRCHKDSTAANPQSKMYAYEAGRRAVEDFTTGMRWNAVVRHNKHLGFYSVEYLPDIFSNRSNVGIVGGKVIGKNRVSGVIQTLDGKEPYQNMPAFYAGYMNRMDLKQDVLAVDIRNMMVNPALAEIYSDIVGISYEEDISIRSRWLKHNLTNDEIIQKSKTLCELVREKGYLVLYDPDM